MCEFSGKLIAWLDQELMEAEMIAVEHHLGSCDECRQRAEAYRAATGAFAAYCDAVAAQPKPKPRPVFRRVAVIGLVAAALVAVLLIPKRGVRPEAPVQQPPPTAARIAAETVTPSQPIGRRAHAPRRFQPAPRVWFAAQPTVQIAIPADAVFPPGVLPEGVAFVVDMSLAQDGSPDRLRLRP